MFFHGRLRGWKNMAHLRFPRTPLSAESVIFMTLPFMATLRKP